MKLKAWTITQLKAQMDKDMALCQTDLERTMCKVICAREIRELANSLSRKLTPGEISIITNL